MDGINAIEAKVTYNNKLGIKAISLLKRASLNDEILPL
jgi:hypothetical protein